MNFAGLGRMIALIWRRDRVRMLVWVTAIALSSAGLGMVLMDMYSGYDDRTVIQETMKSPAMVAMMGPVYDAGGYTLGALYTNFMLIWLLICGAVMNIFHVLRHTREDEESGRWEMVRSLPVGRLSPLTAAMVTALGLNIVLSIATGLAMSALGYESMGFGGSMLYGAAIGAAGMLCGALTALYCQLFSSTAGATGAAFLSLGGMFMLRAVGDVGAEALSLVSPLGLLLRCEVYTRNLWWPVWAALAASGLLTLCAFWLGWRRDLGAGLIPARAGRRRAGALLSSPVGLSWRLLRGTVGIWAGVVLILGAAYGSILGDLHSFVQENEMMKALLAADDNADVVAQALPMLGLVMTIVAGIPVIWLVLALRSQERKGLLSPVLALAAGRRQVMLGYALIALVGGVVFQALSAVGLWAAGTQVLAEPVPLADCMALMMQHVPGLWVLAGAAMVLVGWLPRWTQAAWLYLTYAFLCVYLGGLMGLPAWMEKLTPFGYMPAVASGADNPLRLMSGGVLTALTLAAALLCMIGLLGFKRRNIDG